MKFNPETATGQIHPEANEMLETLRERRNFEPENYLEAKTRMLNEYMADAGLSSCVVAVSGGIDSALALGIVHEAAQQPDSPIKKIYPLALPIYRNEFTKNQEPATQRAYEVCDALDLDLIEIDLTDTYDAMKEAVDSAVGVDGEPWAAGQLVAYLRTPANYYMTSLTTQLKQNGIVCGTTNRDEGAYLGYVGKASDGIVDVQLISDLHKSEVRALYKYLDLPKSILDATPTGDMFDGRVDEEVFGAPYDYVELLHAFKSLPKGVVYAFLLNFTDEGYQDFSVAARNLEDLHRYNSHKYKVGSPAVHLDVMESGVAGGWTHASEKVSREPSGVDKFVNPFELSNRTIDAIYQMIPRRSASEKLPLRLPKGEAFELPDAIHHDVINGMLADADKHGWQPVGIDGIASHYEDGDEIGSLRATTFSPELADYLWACVAPHLSSPLIAEDDPQVDIKPGSIWRPIGVSPLMRFIRYDQGGLLVPHYDAPFAYDEKQMTLKSLVLYADNQSITGGATRFLRDDRLDDSVADRDLHDRTELAKSEDVIESVNPNAGSVIVFDHRILHDSEPVESTAQGGRKVIVRTDVVYSKC